ncbi:MAG: SUMF1/EgtB/PvdO family nonheme iron enzyme [Bacteroidales bacterium]|nr:SUMF1/EgtB/PvdO family nonheme iron enzyme [Bacteroidales bacterium]
MFFFILSSLVADLCAQEFVFVEGGYFNMGCEKGDKDCYPDEQPMHRVYISSFEIGKYEVTLKEYRLFCQKTNRPMPVAPSYDYEDDMPIVNVSWQDANDYAKWKGCRLPTEAEWEYAAKGGQKSMGFTFAGSNDYDEVGWCYENADKRLHNVGQKKPNELGIYDMSGNAWEWCTDNYGISYYENSEQDNPQGPSSGLGKVNRGGSIAFDHGLLNVHHRRCSDASSKGFATGFRLVRDVKK